MNHVERAMELMKKHSEDPPSVRFIAEQIGMSPFYLSRLFSASQGIGPLAYMRRLRLERAAEQLRDNPRASVVEVSFEAGFDSQQTFTRAFTAMFGMPPAKYRRHITARSFVVNKTIPAAASVQLQHSLVSMPFRRYAGFTVTVDSTQRQKPGDAWASLVPRLPLPGQVGDTTYGLCFMETGEGSYRYMAAVLLDDVAEVPSGLETLTLEAQTYLAVDQTMPAVGFGDHLQAGLNTIWSELLPSAGHEVADGPDIESYPASLEAGKTEGVLTHLIPVAVS